MHDINLELFKNYDVLTRSQQVIYTDQDIACFLLEGTNTRLVQNNLFDAISNFVLQGYLLDQEYINSTINLSNRRAFYIYRNGDGETLQYLNTSAKYYVSAAQLNLQSQRITAILLILVSVILLFFCAGFAIIPAIKIIEKSRREIWEIFFEIPGYVCRVMKAKCCDRLNILNEQANIELDERNQEELNAEEAKKEEKNSKGETKEVKKNTAKNKKNSEEKIVLAYDPRQRRVMTAKLLCFFIASLVYFYLIYYTGFEVVQSILIEEPAHINWASRRKELSRGINHWVTEAIFENVTGYGYKFVVPEFQDKGSTYNYANQLINELNYVEDSLIFGNSAEGLSFNQILSSAQNDLLFTNACIAAQNRSIGGNCSAIANGALTQGLHSALGMYTTLATNILLKIKSLNITTLDAAENYLSDPNVVTLRELDNKYLYDALVYSSTLYENDYHNQQLGMQVWQNVLMAIYSVVSLLLFFLVYSPMINKVGQDTKNAWSMCTLIPQEYQEDFKKLNQAIKERKDNFKWR